MEGEPLKVNLAVGGSDELAPERESWLDWDSVQIKHQALGRL